MSDTFKSWIVANLEIVFIPVLILIPLIVVPIRHLESGSVVVIIIVSLVLLLISVLSIKRGIVGFVSAIIIIFFIIMAPADNGEETTATATASSVDFDVIWSAISQHAIFLLIAAILSIIGGIFIAIYAYRNYDEVVSRRFLYRNSNVSVFEHAWKYAFNRQFAGFMLFFGWFLEIYMVCKIPSF